MTGRKHYSKFKVAKMQLTYKLDFKFIVIYILYRSTYTGFYEFVQDKSHLGAYVS